MLFQYRTTQHSLTGRTLAELLMGRTLRTPLKALCPDARSNVVLKQLKQKLHQDKSAGQALLPQPGLYILVNNSRLGLSWLPATVITSTSSSLVQLELADGFSSNPHSDHIRPDDRIQPPYSGSPGRMHAGQPLLDAETPVNAEATPVSMAPQPAPLTPQTNAVSPTLRRSQRVKIQCVDTLP